MMGRRWRLAGLLALVLPALAVSASFGQDDFRITYNVERLEGGRTRVKGVVSNEARGEVLDVYVTAEALDGNKKVVARGISFVSPSIPQRGSAEFTISVPAPATATSFRVRVTSFRMGFGSGTIQGP
jgi:hypothetical protein